jgi:hypothetical protein
MMMSSEIARHAPVRVSLPASVAADIGSLKTAVKSVLDKLGCPQCCSGHDLMLELQRDVLFARDIKAKAEVSFATIPGAAKLDKTPTVRVGLKPEAAQNIDFVFSALDRIADLSGHPACATGCDMLLQLESIYVIDNNVAIDERAMSFARF